MRAWVAAAAAALLLLLAAALFVLAVDVGRWETRLVQDDLVYRATPGRPDLWEQRERLPGGFARALLDLDDDIAFRRALRAFRVSEPDVPERLRPDLISLRREAAVALAELGRADGDPRRRSQASNLLAVLAAGPPGTARGNRLESAILAFRTAVLLDDANEQAKFNLELAYRTRPPSGVENLARSRVGKAEVGQKGAGY